MAEGPRSVLGFADVHRIRQEYPENVEGGCFSMNKTELITAVAQEAEVTKKDAEKTVKAVIDVISSALEKVKSPDHRFRHV